MTVEELIEELEKYPPDYPVVMGYTTVRNVYQDDNFYFGDGSTIMESIGPAVIIE